MFNVYVVMKNKWIYYLVIVTLVCGLLYIFVDWNSKKHLHEQYVRDVKIARENASIERQTIRQKTLELPPEVERLQHLLEVFSSEPNSLEILITIGDIYQKGSYPRYLPNQDIAAMCYKTAALSPDGYVAGIAQSKFVESFMNDIPLEDMNGKQLPTRYAYDACNIAKRYLSSIPALTYQKPYLQNQYEYELVYEQPQQELQVPNNTIITMTPVDHYLWSDAQNVHDHGVTKITKHNVESLQKSNNDSIKSDTNIENIIDSILTLKDIDAATKEKALHVIDTLNDNIHSTYNISEKDALALVWNKIQNNGSKEEKENMKETLAKQLASGIEHGSVVCSSGKISRIVSTLEGTDHIEPVRPIWALKDELANKAIKVRQDVTDEHGEDKTDMMKITFEEQVEKEYIKELGMSPDILKPLISEYLSGFDV